MTTDERKALYWRLENLDLDSFQVRNVIAILDTAILNERDNSLREQLANIARDWSESAAYFHRNGKGVEGNIFDAHATELQKLIKPTE